MFKTCHRCGSRKLLITTSTDYGRIIMTIKCEDCKLVMMDRGIVDSKDRIDFGTDEIIKSLVGTTSVMTHLLDEVNKMNDPLDVLKFICNYPDCMTAGHWWEVRQKLMAKMNELIENNFVEEGFIDPFAEGDKLEAEILAEYPDADPWMLGWEEGTLADGSFGWIRDDGKVKRS